MSEAWNLSGRNLPPIIGEGADGLVQVGLDREGRIVDIVFDPAARSMDLPELATALVAALQHAQDEVRTHPPDDAFSDLPPRERIEAAAAEAEAIGQRRFAEISTALYDLLRHSAGGRE